MSVPYIAPHLRPRPDIIESGVVILKNANLSRSEGITFQSDELLSLNLHDKGTYTYTFWLTICARDFTSSLEAKNWVSLIHRGDNEMDRR